MPKDQIVDNNDLGFINKANILIEALPYIQRLWGKTVVIKYGGNAMVNEDLTRKILEDVTLLKYVGINPILVHGGGPEINAMLRRVDVQSEFHNGLRITDAATMEIVQMVLAGKLNKNIAAQIGTLGGKAIGLCGKDSGLIRVRRKPPLPDGVDLGFVGDIVGVNTKLLNSLCADEYIPVISSVGVDDAGEASMMRTCSPVASATASRAAASGRHRKVMSDALMRSARAAASLRSAGSMVSSSMSSRPARRSWMRSPVVPSLPSM